MIKAIVVDDDKDTVDAFSEYLVINGIDVIGKGYGGKEAVELFGKLKPDVVFLDVLMEKFDGLYALEKIKKINPDAYVVMVTADLSKNTYAKMVSLKASSIIFKPCEIDAILKVINDIRRMEVYNT